MSDVKNKLYEVPQRAQDSGEDEEEKTYLEVVPFVEQVRNVPGYPVVTPDPHRNLVLPTGLREERLPADFRDALLRIRKEPCATCVKTKRPGCTQSMNGTWKCLHCYNTNRLCTWKDGKLSLVHHRPSANELVASVNHGFGERPLVKVPLNAAHSKPRKKTITKLAVRRAQPHPTNDQRQQERSTTSKETTSIKRKSSTSSPQSPAPTQLILEAIHNVGDTCRDLIGAAEMLKAKIDGLSEAADDLKEESAEIRRKIRRLEDVVKKNQVDTNTKLDTLLANVNGL